MLGILEADVMNVMENIKLSFTKIKLDLEALKQNITEWVVLLSNKQGEADSRLKQLEARIAYLEKKHLERLD